MKPTIRLMTEQQELASLSPFAAKAVHSKGRVKPEALCPLRTVYAQDRDRIVHATAFRRLKHKTQVFFAPQADYYRTRLTHTLEVAQIARTIARALQLNEDLVEAIALGHDLGHTPFGHAGERALDEVVPFRFCHSEQSVRVVERLERSGLGLNLTFEVKDGIAHHSYGGADANTLEGKVVEYADKIAYLNHDIDDAIRANILREQELPKRVLAVLGRSKSERITTLICSIVSCSAGQNQINMETQVREAHEALRHFMFEHIYHHAFARGQEPKVLQVIQGLYQYFKMHPNVLPPEFFDAIDQEGMDRVVCDYIAGMSDSFAVKYYETLFIPRHFV